jgi:hypothetical protein
MIRSRLLAGDQRHVKNAVDRSVASPVEFHSEEIKSTIAAAEIIAAKILLELDMGGREAADLWIRN